MDIIISLLFSIFFIMIINRANLTVTELAAKSFIIILFAIIHMSTTDDQLIINLMYSNFPAQYL